MNVMGMANDAPLIVIADPANINARTSLAQKLATAGFSNIEPLGSKHLYEYAQKIETAKGFPRLEKALDFICACMVGAEKTDFLKAVESHASGKKFGTAKFGDLIRVGIAVAEGTAENAVLELMQGFNGKKTTRLFRSLVSNF